jgi:hypothetical protein
VVYAPRPVTWHSRILLIAVAVIAVVAAVLTTLGGRGFPYNAPIEQLYCFGLTVDLVATAIALVALAVVEFIRRANPELRARPLNTRPSVFAIVAVSLSGLALLAWAVGGGLVELITLLSDVRTRYMNHTGGLFLAGIPWALGMVFGAWGFRPGGHRVTSILALVAVVVGVLLAVPTTAAALVYGAGLSD